MNAMIAERLDDRSQTEPSAPERKLPSLVFTDREGGRVVVPLLEGRSLHVGRWRADVTLADGTISRRHASVRLAHGVVQLRDLGSTNGTWVNGRRVARAEIRPGDRVSLGAVSLELRSLPVPPPRPTAVPEIETLPLSAQVVDAQAAEEPGHSLLFRSALPGRCAPMSRAASRAGGPSERIHRDALEPAARVEADEALLGAPLKRQVVRYERDLIRAALQRTRGNQTAAAQLIRLPRRTLIHKLAVLGIDPHRPFGRDGTRSPLLLELDDRSLTFKQRVDGLEGRLVRAALRRSGSRQREAASLLGITVHALAYKIRKHGVRPSR